jgi:hypothetical protein
MGAPFWSLEEKRYFVRECLPRSNYATGSYSSDGKGFEELASIMQRDLDARGHSKRKYKANMLFQMVRALLDHERFGSREISHLYFRSRTNWGFHSGIASTVNAVLRHQEVLQLSPRLHPQNPAPTKLPRVRIAKTARSCQRHRSRQITDPSLERGYLLSFFERSFRLCFVSVIFTENVTAEVSHHKGQSDRSRPTADSSLDIQLPVAFVTTHWKDVGQDNLAC